MSWWAWLILGIYLTAIIVFTMVMRHREHQAWHQERMELLEWLNRHMDGEE